MLISNSFKKWITDNGGYVNDSLTVDYHKQGRRIIANQKIHEGDLLIKMPDKILINEKKFNNIPNINLWIESDISPWLSNNINKTMILLIYLKSLGKNSFYYPYISSLPLLKDLKYLPLFKSNAENLRLWQKLSTNFYTLIKHQIDFVNNFYNKLLELNNTYPIININPLSYNSTTDPDILFSLSQWAYVIYNTRFFGDSDNGGFIPFVDIFQHNYQSDIVLTISEGNVIIQNKSEISTNEEIYLNYGIYDTTTILANYGILPTNDLMYMNITINTNIRNKFIEKELEQFKNTKFYLTNLFPEVKLFYYLRIASLNDYEIKTRQLTDKFYYKSRISLENELKILRLILNLINNLKISQNFDINKKKMCVDLKSSASCSAITIALTDIVLSNNNIIQGCMYWVHNEWLKMLDSPYLINDKLMINENKIQLFNTIK